MKKAFMLVAAIALLAAPVFAEVAVTISGEATTSFGYNLDTQNYGILSEVGSDIAITVGALDGEKMGEGNWYGVIELTGASLVWDTTQETVGVMTWDWNADDEVWEDEDGVDHSDDVADGNINYLDYTLTAPDVSAKITNGNVYVQLQTEADFDADYVDDADLDEQAISWADDYASSVSGSLTVGATFAPVTFAVELATAGDYTQADADWAKGVALGANLGLDLAPITVDVAFAGAFGYAADQNIGFAAKVAADLAPVTVTAAFDGIAVAGGDFLYEAGLAVDLAMDPITVSYDAYFTEKNLDMKVAVGFANDMLTADAFFGLSDLLADTDMVWSTGIDVTVTPVSGIAFAAGWSVDSDIVMAAYANVAFTELVDNVTFTLGWEDANDMLDNTTDADTTDLGQIFLSAGIAF